MACREDENAQKPKPNNQQQQKTHQPNKKKWNAVTIFIHIYFFFPLTSIHTHVKYIIVYEVKVYLNCIEYRQYSQDAIFFF